MWRVTGNVTVVGQKWTVLKSTVLKESMKLKLNLQSEMVGGGWILIFPGMFNILKKVYMYVMQ